MNDLTKQIGGRTEAIVGHTAFVAPIGYGIYFIYVRQAGATIASVTEKGGTVVTDNTWEGIALDGGDQITLEKPITSITLTADADSVLVYCAPI
jgi:hypothetical protein